jgi:hypothetical protein
MAALSSIGVFAAMTTWLHDSSCERFMARPSRTISRHGVPDSRWNAKALRTARGRLVAGPDRTRRSTNSVRSTRWGTPSTCVVTIVSVTAFAR